MCEPKSAAIVPGSLSGPSAPAAADLADLTTDALAGKPWWQSATIRGLVSSAALTLVSALSLVLARWGIPADASYLIALALVLLLLSLLGQGYAWLGRVRGVGGPIDPAAVLPGLSRRPQPVPSQEAPQ